MIQIKKYFYHFDLLSFDPLSFVVCRLIQVRFKGEGACLEMNLFCFRECVAKSVNWTFMTPAATKTKSGCNPVH